MKALLVAAIVTVALVPHPAKAALAPDVFLTEEIQPSQKDAGIFERYPGLAVGLRIGNSRGVAIVPLAHFDNDYRFQTANAGIAAVAPLGRHVDVGFAFIGQSHFGQHLLPSIIVGAHF